MTAARPVERVLSGGQTGADRAALDAALAAGVPCGGWCPRGRRAEDGRVPAAYPLRETPGWQYPQRTEWNVRDAGATLILATGEPDRGTALTARLAGRLGRPCLSLDPTAPAALAAAADWIRRHGVRVLNVAGPRESAQPGLYAAARDFLERLLDEVARKTEP